MENRKWKFLVLGGSSFVAKHFIKYLLNSSQANSKLTFDWAITVRNQAKKSELENVVKNFKRPVEILMVDAFDRKALDQVIGQAEIVVNFIGPYDLYSHGIVDSCLENSTHYFDITGEFLFIKKMIDRCHEKALKSKTFFFPSSGFDSIPSDFGCFKAIEAFQNKFERNPKKVQAFYSMRGGLNGGTFATMMDLGEKVKDQDMASSNFLFPDAPNRKVDMNWTQLSFTKKIGSPFFMAPINVKTVTRSLALRGISNIEYQEYMKAQSQFEAKSIEVLLKAADLFAKNNVMRGILKKVGPGPGQGPSDKTVENGFFKANYIASDKTDFASVTLRSAGDPGNGATIRLLASALFCFIEKGSKVYGVQTAVNAFGNCLLPYLQENDIQVSVE